MIERRRAARKAAAGCGSIEVVLLDPTHLLIRPIRDDRIEQLAHFGREFPIHPPFEVLGYQQAWCPIRRRFQHQI